jgi:hypothetical protein
LFRQYFYCFARPICRRTGQQLLLDRGVTARLRAFASSCAALPVFDPHISWFSSEYIMSMC